MDRRRFVIRLRNYAFINEDGKGYGKINVKAAEQLPPSWRWAFTNCVFPYIQERNEQLWMSLPFRKYKTSYQHSHLSLPQLSENYASPILMRIYKKMRNGIQFAGIRTSENLIIDGHHRYVAALLAEIELDITPTQKTSATEAVAWKEVEIDTQDWDTPAKILMLNELDAKNNQLSLEAISKMLE